jgi:hypothetical protein
MARAASPRRASRRQIRLWAWIAGALSFFAPFGLFGASPRPTAGAAAVKVKPPHTHPPKRPVVVVVTKKIVIEEPATSSSVPATTTTSSGPVNYVYAPAPAAPAPAPVTVSCGTHPC